LLSKEADGLFFYSSLDRQVPQLADK